METDEVEQADEVADEVKPERKASLMIEEWISSESTKLSHTIAMLQLEIAQEVRDILMIMTDASQDR